MHHTLLFYARHRHRFLRLYILLASLTSIPLLGRLVRLVANIYGRRGHHGYPLTLEQAEQIIDSSKIVALGPCSCRQVFHNCPTPIMVEILVGIGVQAFSQLKPGEFHEVSKEEAKAILRQCHQKRMIQTIMRCQEYLYAICNCCTCCCVPTRLRRDYGIGYALIRSQEVVDQFRSQQI